MKHFRYNFFRIPLFFQGEKAAAVTFSSGVISISCWKLSVFLLFFVPGGVPAWGKTDFQIWNYNRVQGQLNRTVGVSAEIEFRFRDSARQFYYTHEHIELPLRVSSFLVVGPAYRQVFNLPAGEKNQWRTTYQPNLNLTFEWHLGPWLFYDRSRISWLIRTGVLHNAWQYRNKLGVSRVLTPKLHEVRFFADGEIFLEQRRPGIYEYRASVGYNIGLFRKIRMDLAYRRRNIKPVGSGWNHDNILMLNLYALF